MNLQSYPRVSAVGVRLSVGTIYLLGSGEGGTYIFVCVAGQILLILVIFRTSQIQDILRRALIPIPIVELA